MPKMFNAASSNHFTTSESCSTVLAYGVCLDVFFSSRQEEKCSHYCDCLGKQMGG